ncbi:MAG: hypothetical protein IRY85_09065 [Micromonosporaceae bacterium]|nr:hypothetical protein [Micromonosporaceae bacterium]
MRRDLERGPNPVVALLPRYLFASALVSQLVALIAGLPAIADIARGVLATAVIVGLVALTVLLVDYTITPAGSRAHRLRGLASGWTSAMVIGFMFAWCLEAEGAHAGSVFLVELVSFAGGMLCARDALRLAPVDSYGDVVA